MTLLGAHEAQEDVAAAFLFVKEARALRRIADSPLAEEDGSARRGQVGDVCDCADGYAWVDFGGGAIPCYPDEIAPVYPRLPGRKDPMP